MRTTVNKTIRELRGEKMPHATCESIGLALTPKDDTDEARQSHADALILLNRYFDIFATGKDCPACGSEIGGLLGTFRWGIVNGEGECSHCGYPVRALHNNDIFTGMTLCLPYHPDIIVTYRGSPEFETERDALSRELDRCN